jgi:hypothetical protein
MYIELNEAMEEVLKNVHEEDEFKRRLKKLIENSLEQPYLNDDIRNVLKLTKVFTEGAE